MKVKTKLVHCSFHKCLTVYYSKVMATLYNRILIFSKGYRHFNSHLNSFYRESNNFTIASVNNHALDLDQLGGDCRVTLFVRDPRDLVVSGYFYHKRGAEAWCDIIDPEIEDWSIVNGCIPENLPKGRSYASFLQGVSKEDGLMAEIGFRRNHFNSMQKWLDSADTRVKLFRYEDLVGNEASIFSEIFAHYDISGLELKLGVLLAEYFSAGKLSKYSKHIRNPEAGQWKKHFSAKVQDYFEQEYGELLIGYDYS